MSAPTQLRLARVPCVPCRLAPAHCDKARPLELWQKLACTGSLALAGLHSGSSSTTTTSSSSTSRHPFFAHSRRCGGAAWLDFNRPNVGALPLGCRPHENCSSAGGAVAPGGRVMKGQATLRTDSACLYEGRVWKLSAAQPLLCASWSASLPPAPPRPPAVITPAKAATDPSIKPGRAPTAAASSQLLTSLCRESLQQQRGGCSACGPAQLAGACTDA